MTSSMIAENFLTDNRHVYAVKAVRKKSAIIRIQVTNRDSTEMRVDLGSAKLTADGKRFDAARPEAVIRKLSTFTWDFFLFFILDLFQHPLVALADACIFLGGPIYNRWLKRQLSVLSDGEMIVAPGDCKSALVAFRGVSKNLERLTIPLRGRTGEQEELEYEFSRSA